jgi:hypothetical protein
LPQRANLLSRRKFLALTAAAGASLALAACGDDDDDEPTATSAVATEPTATTEAPAEPTEASGGGAQSEDDEQTEVEVVVADVVDFSLEPDGWEGPFGSVTMRMYKGHFEGEDVYFIRTDASDQEFAEQEGLVFVPILQNALQAEGSFANLYTFAQSADGQGAVVTTIPGREDYTPAFHVHTVTFAGEPELITSEADLLAAQDAGTVTVEETGVVVNYPMVRWGDEGLPVDSELTAPLGQGPLVAEPDMEELTCTFKLHQCFPGSRYIVTDTSAVPMAPMMGVVGSGATDMLREAGATAPITIFVNGLDGPGVEGFQPAIFNSKAGNPIWSPFWDHFAAEWTNPEEARVVRSQSELDELVKSGELTLYNGVPDTHPNGFVVNCPAPILAPNDYDA